MPFAQKHTTTTGSFYLIPKPNSGRRFRKNTPEKRFPIPSGVVPRPSNALPTLPATASRCSTTPSTTRTIRWSASPPEREEFTKTTAAAVTAIQCLQLQRNNGPLSLCLPKFPTTTRQATATTTPSRLLTSDSTTKQKHIFSTAMQPSVTPAPTAVRPVVRPALATNYQRTTVVLPLIEKRTPWPPARQAPTRRLQRGPSIQIHIQIRIQIHTRVVPCTSSSQASTRPSSALSRTSRFYSGL